MSKPKTKKPAKKTGAKTRKTKKVTQVKGVTAPGIIEGTYSTPEELAVRPFTTQLRVDEVTFFEQAGVKTDAPSVAQLEPEVMPQALKRKKLASLGLGAIGLIMMLSALAMLLSGCATVPTAVAQRRALAGELRACLTSPMAKRSLATVKNCLAESRARCRAAGLEATCASDDLFTKPL